MDYVTSIENTPYMRWQVALLHESLQLHGLADNLVVLCAESGNDKILPYKRVLYHANIGDKARYKCANRAYGLKEAVRLKMVTQPFVSVDPDTFMMNPIKPIDLPMELQRVWYMTPECIKEYDGIDVEKEFDIPANKWIGAGCLYHFNNVPNSLFESIYDNTLEISHRYIEGDGKLKNAKSYWQRDMFAYNIAFAKSNIHGRLTTQYEANLDPRTKPNYKNANFVHYCNGVHPYFDKRKHNGLNWFSLEPAVPFEAILGIPAKTDEIRYFQAVVKSYLNRRLPQDDFFS